MYCNKTPEEQYVHILENIVKNGIDVINERTKSKCRTLLNQCIKFNGEEFPLCTTRKSYWKQAIGEMLGYIRAYDSTEKFHTLGVHTWDANAQNPEWLIRKEILGVDIDLGLIYGVSAELVGISYSNIISKLQSEPNDRGIIWSFWNPEYFPLGCLRPCMYSHQFSVLNDTLHLTSTQRSCDMPLGGNFNMIQCWFLLNVTAQLTGLKVGTVTWNITNAHIYENQLDLVKEQCIRNPYSVPKFVFKKKLTLNDVLKNITKDNFDEYFEVQDYQYHPPIKYPFTV